MKSQLFALTSADQEIYRTRRLKLMQNMPQGLAFLDSGQHLTRSNDTEFPFRANSNFYYLTGFAAPNCVLLLDSKRKASTLFVAKRVPEMELWTGEMLGPERVRDFLGIEESFELEKMQETCKERLKDSENLLLDLHRLKNSSTDSQTLDWLKSLQNTRRRNFNLPESIVHLPTFIEKMRLIKEHQEIQWMQESNNIAKKAHAIAMSSASHMKCESHLQAQIEWACKLHGAPSMAYETIVASGDRANTLHYINNNHALKKEELVLIDAGCEVNYMASDITRTFPVGGKFSSAQRDVYQVVLRAQQSVLDFAKVGSTITQCHDLAMLTLAQGLNELGVLQGNPEEIQKSDQFKTFYPHGTSHWLGMDVHDQCPYKDEHCKDITFLPGMAFTIEPALYFAEQNQLAPKHLKGIGIRIEDDVIVQEKTLLNLTAGLAKTIPAIEAQCARSLHEVMQEHYALL